MSLPNVALHHTANENFSRARTRQTIQKFINLLNPDSQDLLSLREVRETLRPKGESYRGLQVVRIDRIVGSEGRYKDFDKHFLPRHDHLRKRWTRVDEAHLSQVILPPIRLYEIGGVFFVRDGNHRVSVARSQGGVSIDAEVVSLDSEIRLEPGLTRDKLKQAVIDYEHRLFNRRTRFDRIYPDADLRFTAPGRYDEVLNHIEGHKYYINQNYQEEIPFEAAMRSWYTHVYTPIIETIREMRLPGRFPGRTEADLYVWLVKHWDELKRAHGDDVPIRTAAEDLDARFGRSLWQQLRDALTARKERRRRERLIARGELIE